MINNLILGYDKTYANILKSRGLVDIVIDRLLDIGILIAGPQGISIIMSLFVFVVIWLVSKFGQFVRFVLVAIGSTEVTLNPGSRTLMLA